MYDDVLHGILDGMETEIYRNGMNMEKIIELLNRKYCLSVLMNISNNAGATKAEILRLDPGNERSKFLRIGDLAEAGLVTLDDENRQHNAIRVYLSPLGQQVVNQLDRLVDVYNRETGTKA